MYDFSNDNFKLTDYHQMDDGLSILLHTQWRTHTDNLPLPGFHNMHWMGQGTRLVVCTCRGMLKINVLWCYSHLITGSSPHQPIPVASLADHVERNHLNENCGFSEEYKVGPILNTGCIINMATHHIVLLILTVGHSRAISPAHCWCLHCSWQ